MTNRPLAGLLVLTLGLAGCSSDKKDTGILDAVRAKAAAVTSKLSRKSKAAPTGVTRAQIVNINSALIDVRIVKSGSYSVLAPVRNNAGAITWLTADRISLTFRQGVLIASRGLGQDLIAADVSTIIEALQTGEGHALSRRMKYLSGDNHLITMKFSCDISSRGGETIDILGVVHKAEHFVQSCSNATENFENDYWIDPKTDIIWKSNQWVSPDVGVISVRRLKSG